jgi:sarcosine oxidase subunit beta
VCLECFDGLKQNQKTQRELGLTTTLLEAEEVMRLIPAMNPDVIAGGLLQANGGFARHDAAIWGYARAGRRLGVDIFPSTWVTDTVVQSGRVRTLKTTGGEIETRKVVNAAKGYI